MVLGAGGHTGRFVMDLLRARGVEAVPATRTGFFSPISGETEKCRVLDFSLPSVVDALFADADAVINCAGPFFDTAAPAVSAALRAGIPYLDVAAEQETVRRIFDRFGPTAEANGVTIIPGMAFFGGLADLLVSTLVVDGKQCDSIEIAIGLDSWHPTNGTRITGDQNVFPRVIVRGGALVPMGTQVEPRNWAFPEPLGQQPVIGVSLSEMILLSRHVNARSITSYMNLAPLNDLNDKTTPPPQAAHDDGRSAQRFIVDVVVSSNGQQQRVTATGTDIYAVSAPLVVNACMILLEGRTKAGVRAPGEVFEAAEFLAGLDSSIRLDTTYGTSTVSTASAAISG